MTREFVHAEIAVLRGELKTEIADLRGETRAGFAELRDELQKAISGQTRFMFVILTTLATVLGVVITFAN